VSTKTYFPNENEIHVYTSLSNGDRTSSPLRILLKLITKRWDKRNKELDTLSGWVRSRRGISKSQIKVISHQKIFFVRYHYNYMHNYSEVEIEKICVFPIGNIFVVGGSRVL
jgi:hypothetical protein